MHHLLNLLIWLPIVGGVFVAFVGRDDKPNVSRYLSLFIVLLTLFLCIPLMRGFDTSIDTMQFIDDIAWMPALGIQYSLGIDGLSLLLIVLTAFTNLIVILATWDSIKKRIGQYMASF